MFDNQIGQFQFKEETENREVNKLLFPRPRKDETRVIAVIIEAAVEVIIGIDQFLKAELTSAQVNGLLFPQIKEESKSTSAFVERRRFAR
jgi:hypothetical protein